MGVNGVQEALLEALLRCYINYARTKTHTQPQTIVSILCIHYCLYSWIDLSLNFIFEEEERESKKWWCWWSRGVLFDFWLTLFSPAAEQNSERGPDGNWEQSSAHTLTHLPASSMYTASSTWMANFRFFCITSGRTSPLSRSLSRHFSLQVYPHIEAKNKKEEWVDQKRQKRNTVIVS